MPKSDVLLADDARVADVFTCGERVSLVANILKIFIGSGVLFLAKAFSNGGWLFSIIAMSSMALLTNFTISKLIACRAAMPAGATYGDMGRRVAGKWGARAVDVALVLSQAGFCCVYISFIARNTIQLLNVPRCWVPASSLWVIVLLELPLLTPLTWVRKLSSFGPTNLIADALISAGIIAILAYCVSHMASGPPLGGALSLPAMRDSSHWPLMLGTAVYAFEGAGMVVPLINSLGPAGRARFPTYLVFTLAGVTVLYVVIGIVPYAYFAGWEGVPVQDAVTLNLPKTGWSITVIAGYCLALLFSYPLMMFPAMRIMEDAAMPYIFPGAAAAAGAVVSRARSSSDDYLAGSGADIDDASSSNESAEDDAALLAAAVSASGRTSATAKWRKNVFRTGVVAVTLLVAYVGSSQLDNFVALIGAFCCTPIAFIFPAWFHAVLVSGPTAAASANSTRTRNFARLNVVIDWVIVFVGVCIGIFSTYMAIAGWSSSVFDPCPS